MEYKILVADDDKEIREAIEIYLTNEQMKVLTACDGQEALKVLEANPDIHLIIMDLMMPKMDGIQAILQIRKEKEIPIIVLSAKSEDKDVVLGLNIGADDYITKPFSPVVLQKKIAVLTKYITEKQKETVYEDGNLCINFSQMTATLDKVPLELSPLEYRILQYFIVNKKHILKRDQLLEHLWDFSENFVGDTSLNTAISRLRKKIEASGHRYIKTIYGTGYMWIGD